MPVGFPVTTFAGEECEEVKLCLGKPGNFPFLTFLGSSCHQNSRIAEGEKRVVQPVPSSSRHYSEGTSHVSIAALDSLAPADLLALRNYMPDTSQDLMYLMKHYAEAIPQNCKKSYTFKVSSHICDLYILKIKEILKGRTHGRLIKTHTCHV